MTPQQEQQLFETLESIKTEVKQINVKANKLAELQVAIQALAQKLPR